MDMGVTKQLAVIGAASCWGAPDNRCDMGPSVIRANGLDSRLRYHAYDVDWRHLAAPCVGHEDQDVVALIGQYCSELAQYVLEAVSQGRFFSVIGGDHSCAVGTWSGVHAAINERGPLGLIWVDAHMDSHTPETSHSGAVHGMPLAALLGYGDPALTQIGVPKPKLSPEHVCLVGVRSYETEEANFLKRLGVRVFDSEEVQRQGLNAVMKQAQAIARNGTAGYGISIDLDAIDPVDAPGVGSPEPGGLGGADLTSVLGEQADATDFIGVEIAELNPSRDRNGLTARLVSELIVACCRTG